MRISDRKLGTCPDNRNMEIAKVHKKTVKCYQSEIIGQRHKDKIIRETCQDESVKQKGVSLDLETSKDLPNRASVPWPLLQIAIEHVPGKAKRKTEEKDIETGKLDRNVSIATKDLNGKQTAGSEDSTPWPRSVGLIKLKRYTELKTRLSDDPNTCKIVEMSVTKEGVLLVVDMFNKRLKAFSPENRFLSCVNILNVPLSVAVIDATTAVVTADDKRLNFIDISDLRAMKISNTIKLDYIVLGIANALSKLVVIALTKPRCVKMLELNGTEICSIETDAQGNPLFGKPEYITSFGTKSQEVIVSDYLKQRLTFINCKDRMVIRKVKLIGMGPEGLAIDSHNNVYAVFHDDNDIRVFSEDLKQSRVLLAWWGGWLDYILNSWHSYYQRYRVPYPVYYSLRNGGTAIAFNSVTSELYVSYDTAPDSIDCFKLSLDGF